ncbi:MAG: glycosyltransferase, partial [Chloroflexota bacterium]|nr:glycosyltransferase [Chloroflexota bacterium]
FAADARSPREALVRSTIASALGRDIAPERRSLPAVIAWSRLEPRKNHIGLVRAFAGSAALRDQANLLIVTRGLADPLHRPATDDPPVLRTLVDEIERANLWGSVSAFILEGQDALAALYRWGAETGGVFCVPSEHEPFSLTLIEAMATGLAVVATSNGGPQEITAHGRAGLLADPTDSQHIAAQLLRLLSDSTLRERHARRGRERVRERYTWDLTARGYVRLARQIAAGKRTGDPAAPLPDFALTAAPLPRLGSWRRAAEPVGEVVPVASA